LIADIEVAQAAKFRFDDGASASASLPAVVLVEPVTEVVIPDTFAKVLAAVKGDDIDIDIVIDRDK
jgi:hypothetical protein